MTTILTFILVAIGLAMALMFGSAVVVGLAVFAIIAGVVALFGAVFSWPVLIVALIVWMMLRNNKKSCDCSGHYRRY
jgi:hypothetical protein